MSKSLQLLLLIIFLVLFSGIRFYVHNVNILLKYCGLQFLNLKTFQRTEFMRPYIWLVLANALSLLRYLICCIYFASRCRHIWIFLIIPVQISQFKNDFYRNWHFSRFQRLYDGNYWYILDICGQIILLFISRAFRDFC